MANLTITAANVVQSSGDVEHGTAGESVTAGQVVFKKATDSKYWLAQCDAATDDDAYGIALHAAAANQPLSIARSGIINLGATLAVGTQYVLSATAGAICPDADLTSTNYVTTIGIGISTSLMALRFYTSSIQRA